MQVFANGMLGAEIYGRLRVARNQRLPPNVERVEIAGASHPMREENAAVVNGAILEFLLRVGQRR